MTEFFIYGFRMILVLNGINNLTFVMVKCGVLFEVRTGFLVLFRQASSLKG
jgi:hypothetical protein